MQRRLGAGWQLTCSRSPPSPNNQHANSPAPSSAVLLELATLHEGWQKSSIALVLLLLLLLLLLLPLLPSRQRAFRQTPWGLWCRLTLKLVKRLCCHSGSCGWVLQHLQQRPGPCWHLLLWEGHTQQPGSERQCQQQQHSRAAMAAAALAAGYSISCFGRACRSRSRSRSSGSGRCCKVFGLLLPWASVANTLSIMLSGQTERLIL